MSPHKIIRSLSMNAGGLLAAAAFIIPLSSHATSFVFGDCSAGGCGTADMDISISVNTLTLVLDNTSPLTLDDGTGTNTPGITSFGFNLLDPNPNITGWTLTALNTDGTGPVNIDDQTVSGTGDWVMSSTQAGVTLDFLPSAGDPANIQGALYNDMATAGFGATPNYETIATLVITFDAAPILAEEKCFKNKVECTTYVRYQNVGLNGSGSLKLPGGPSGEDPPSAVPEPNVLALMSMGMLGGLFMRRRLRKENS